MTQLTNITEESFGQIRIKGFCPVDVAEIYKSEGLNTHRHLIGDYCIEIVDGYKKIYITDFFGTYCDHLPRNSTIVIENNEITYRKDNINMSPYYYAETRVKTLDDFFEAIDEAVKLRCANNPTILMSSGQDSGTIVASALKQNLEFETLSITGLEDQNILGERLQLLKNPTVIREWSPGIDSHLVAAMNSPTNVILSGLGADEAYWSGDFQLMRKFIRNSYKHYSKHNIQVRYPLLDYRVYINFFVLADEQMKRRKACLVEYMKSLNFPHKPNLKVPFFLGNGSK